MLTYEWAAALQMPGFVMSSGPDPEGSSYRLMVDGAECGRVELMEWYESELPNSAAVALLCGIGDVPASLMPEDS